MRFVLPLVALLMTVNAGRSADHGADGTPGRGPATEWTWLTFPDPRLELRGLPWFTENAPELWRLPRSAKSRVPAGVWARAVAADGARIRFRSSTARLALRVTVARTPARGTFFDAYVGQRLAGSAKVSRAGDAEIVLFQGQQRDARDVTVYLPHTSEVRVLAVGIDSGATLEPPPPFPVEAPLVCYGSSVLQGTGADHPGSTYPAIVARRLNIDFINLGFGGAGKAEPEVVGLVNALTASCFLFDLGKSYGDQASDPFAQMLARVRSAHPATPIVCVTPIYSTREESERDYAARSVHLRDMMRAAANDRRANGDSLTFVTEGLDLFGPGDRALFRDPQHPNDQGNELMAQRLEPVLRGLILVRR